MASTRIPVAWLLLLAVLAVFAFFGYHILNASTSSTDEKFPPYLPERPVDAAVASGLMGHAVKPEISMGAGGASAMDHAEMSEETAAPVVERVPPHKMPRVSGQSEEDLRAPRPVQRTPPTTHYEEPEATDPLNRHVHMSSEFGSNLRHPEQMIEAHPGVGDMHTAVEAGIASEYSSPGGNRAVGYSKEMVQNGGEWMRGIDAFDMSDSGIAYSML